MEQCGGIVHLKKSVGVSRCGKKRKWQIKIMQQCGGTDAWKVGKKKKSGK